MFCSVRVSKYIHSFTDDSCLQREAAGSRVHTSYLCICQVGGVDVGWMLAGIGRVFAF